MKLLEEKRTERWYQNDVKINGSTITGTTYNVSGLTVATTYAYIVKAKDGNAKTYNFKGFLQLVR